MANQPIIGPHHRNLLPTHQTGTDCTSHAHGMQCSGSAPSYSTANDRWHECGNGARKCVLCCDDGAVDDVNGVLPCSPTWLPPNHLRQGVSESLSQTRFRSAFKQSKSNRNQLSVPAEVKGDETVSPHGNELHMETSHENDARIL